MRVVEEFLARGHPNITAKHPSTLEITKQDKLTKNGDCIIAVEATKGLWELSETFRRTCADDNSKIRLEVSAHGIVDVVYGKGNAMLTLNHPDEIVVRKSSYVSDRTLMIAANKAAGDLKRRLVTALRSLDTLVVIRIVVENGVTEP